MSQLLHRQSVKVPESELTWFSDCAMVHIMQKVTNNSNKPWLITNGEKCFVSIICDIYSSKPERWHSLTFTLPPRGQLTLNLLLQLFSPSVVHLVIAWTHGLSFKRDIEKEQKSSSAISKSEHHTHHLQYVHIYTVSPHPVTHLVTVYPKCPQGFWWTIG